MAYGMRRRYGRRRYGRRFGRGLRARARRLGYGRMSLRGLHGQRLHRETRRGRMAHFASRRAYRRMRRLPRRVVAKAYANTVGQIVYRSGRMRPSHSRRTRY